MPTNFPTSLDSYTNKVDAVDTVQAAHVNNLQDAVVAIETFLGVGAISGSWTPTDASGAALSFSGAGGSYYRFGNLVIAMFALTFPSTANGSNAKIGGLPFAAINTSIGRTGFISYTNMNVSRTIAPDAGAATFSIFNLAGTFVTNANMSTFVMQGVLIYSK